MIEFAVLGSTEKNFKFMLLRLSSLDWDSQISFEPRKVISVILNQISRKELTGHYWLSSLYSALPLPRQGRAGCWLFSLWHLLLWLKASCSFRTTGPPWRIWARQDPIFYTKCFWPVVSFKSLLKLGFPTGRDSANFRDKETEVPSLSWDREITGLAKN